MLRPGRGHGSLPTSTNGGGFGVGYGDMPSHSSVDADQKYSRRRSSSSGGSVLGALIKSPLVICMVLCICLFGSTLYYRRQSNKALAKLENIHEDAHQWRKDAKRGLQDTRAYEDRTRKLEQENSQLQKDAEELRKQLKDKGGNVADSTTNTNTDHTKKMQEGHRKTIEHYAKRETAWRHQLQKLQNATARESKRTALERFGPGPHRVKFQLHFPHDDDDHLQQDTSRTFVVEMAPLDKMPHAVHLFLEQVDHQLWDDTWFYLNGQHVLQAGPQAYEDEHPDELEELKLKEFEKYQLSTLSFPEYSTEYPHVQWTLGFTGRPGGPDWYINKSDNTKTHGPGGQRQHTLLEQADPCFAKVVEGFDTLESMMKLEVYNREVEYANFFVDPVAIVQARIIKSEGDANKIPPKQQQEKVKKEEHHNNNNKKQQDEHKKKPIVSHRADVHEDDILTEEDWHFEDEYDDDHYQHHHEEEDHGHVGEERHA